MNYFNNYKKLEVYNKLSIARQAKLVKDNEHYSLVVPKIIGNAVLCLGSKSEPKQHVVEVVLRADLNQPLTPEVCVELCRKILGLKVNEIAKVIGISRATLDLHRKGANVKEKELRRYQQLHSFVININELYGETLKKGMRNVLIEKKTLVQHIVNNANNLDNVMQLVDNASTTFGAIKVDNSVTDPLKLQSRLVGIGKFA